MPDIVLIDFKKILRHIEMKSVKYFLDTALYSFISAELTGTEGFSLHKAFNEQKELKLSGRFGTSC